MLPFRLEQPLSVLDIRLESHSQFLQREAPYCSIFVECGTVGQ